MNFELTEQQRLFQASAAEFVDRHVAPRAEAIDEAGEFPRELFEMLGAQGYFGCRYPERYGGSDAGFFCFILLIEEIARGSLALAAATAMQSLMGTHFIHACGTEEHRQRLLVPALRGTKLGTIAMTEPDYGSDLGGMTTRAVRDGDGWVIDGRKSWITSASVADFFTVAAKTDPEAGFKGIDLFLVERGAEGLSVGRQIHKLGVRASETAELVLDGVRGQLLGEQGTGYKLLGGVLDDIRVMTGALGLGLARAAIDHAATYAGERVQFGRPIGRFQAVSHQLAQAATELEAARWLVYRAAWDVSNGMAELGRCAMAKLFASEMANRAADTATRVLGSYGFAMEYAAQRYFRDARFLLYGGGTSEILRGVIARGITD